MNLWETEKELIRLKQNSLTKEEKEIVLNLLRDMEHHRYLLPPEMELFSKLEGTKVIPRGEQTIQKQKGNQWN